MPSFTSWNTVIGDFGEFDSGGYISQLGFSLIYDSLSETEYSYAVDTLSSIDMTIHSFYDIVTADVGYITHTSLEPDDDYRPTITYLEATVDNTQAVAYSTSEGRGLQSKFGFTSGSTSQDIYEEAIMELIGDFELQLNPTRQTFRRLSPGSIGPHNLMSFGSWRLKYTQESERHGLLGSNDKPVGVKGGGY